MHLFIVSVATLWGVGWQHKHKHANTKVHLRPFCYCSEIFKLLVYYCVVIVSTKHDWTNSVTDQLLTDLFIAWQSSLVVLCNSPNKTQMFPFSRPWGKHFFVTPESNLFDVVEHHIQLFPREKTVDGCGGASAVGNDCMLLTVKQTSDLRDLRVTTAHLFLSYGKC